MIILQMELNNLMWHSKTSLSAQPSLLSVGALHCWLLSFSLLLCSLKRMLRKMHEVNVYHAASGSSPESHPSLIMVAGVPVFHVTG